MLLAYLSWSSSIASKGPARGGGCLHWWPILQCGRQHVPLRMQYPSHFVPVSPLTKEEVTAIMVKVFKFLLRKTNYAINPPLTLAILCFN